jgi:hypothetical protein
MKSHLIEYEGLEFEVFGEWEDSEEEVGYYGGWTTYLIKINEVDIYNMLKEDIVDKITTKLIEKNY